MVKIRTSAFIVLSVILFEFFIINTFLKGQDNKYAAEKTKEIINKMIEAHGGYEKWKNAPAISYDNIFFNPGAQKMKTLGGLRTKLLTKKQEGCIRIGPCITPN